MARDDIVAKMEWRLAGWNLEEALFVQGCCLDVERSVEDNELWRLWEIFYLDSGVQE